MDRQEPTLGKKIDLAEVEFRPRSYRGPSRESDHHSGLWLKIALGAAAVILVAMGLIEWNARRQAAALTAELMRPMTAKEEAQLKAQMMRWEAQMEAETAKELNEVQRQIWVDPSPDYTPRAPLQPGQRCMQGRRLERIDGGWRDLPHEPC